MKKKRNKSNIVIYAIALGLFIMFIAYNVGKVIGKKLADKEKTEKIIIE